MDVVFERSDRRRSNVVGAEIAGRQAASRHLKALGLIGMLREQVFGWEKLFESVREAREATEHWLQEYKTERPHGSLFGRSPELFFEQWEEQQREAA